MYVEISEFAKKLSGRHVNKVDAKGRTFLPAKLKNYMIALWGPKPDLILAVMGFDRCLVLVRRKNWYANKTNLDALDWFDPDAAKLKRLSSLVVECTIDSQGRIAIPQVLRAFAGITDEVTFVGCESYIELWQPVAAEENLSALIEEAPELIERVRTRIRNERNEPEPCVPVSDDSAEE